MCRYWTLRVGSGSSSETRRTTPTSAGGYVGVKLVLHPAEPTLAFTTTVKPTVAVEETLKTMDAFPLASVVPWL
jgi:hypothetical protein